MLFRSATYMLTAERLQAHGAPGRIALYARMMVVFAKGLRLAGEHCVRVEIPYGNAHIAGLYVRANKASGPAPILVQLNGLDSTKEMKYRVGLPRWLAQRGVSSLLIDQPGTGEALRLHTCLPCSTAKFGPAKWWIGLKLIRACKLKWMPNA